MDSQDTNDARVFDGFCLKKLITFQEFYYLKIIFEQFYF